MIAVNVLPKFRKEKADALFYRMIRRRLLRKRLGRMIRSGELRTFRINRTSSRSKEEEKVATLFYKMVIRRLLRKWLGGRMIRSQEHHMLKIDRTGSRSKGNENPSELRD